MREVKGKGYIADYKKDCFVDGEGVRCSLYVSGCPFHCPGCFNATAQNFTYGTKYTSALEKQILTDVAASYVQGLSLLGGEPFLNTAICLPLVQAFRQKFQKTKDLWVWTGYTFEQLQRQAQSDQEALLQEVDVLIDGPYIEAKRCLNENFYGSTNQRIIDVQKSFATGEVILWTKN